MSRKKGRISKLDGVSKNSGSPLLKMVKNKPEPEPKSVLVTPGEKKLVQDYTAIFSDRGKPITLTHEELGILQKHYPDRTIWPGILSWLRVRNYPGYQMGEKVTDADSKLVWAERQKFFLEGYNMSILMNDSNIIGKTPENPKKTKSGIVLNEPPKLV